MAPKHAEALQVLEFAKNEVVHLRSRFDENAKDVDWITTLGEEGDWIIVSGDVRITKNPAERAAWIESGLTAFFFGDAWSMSSYWIKAADLVAWWPDIIRQARNKPSGHGYLIPKGGKEMRQLYPRP